jgi:transposase-like protein
VPKKIDPKVKERCVQQMLEHAAEYPNPTAAAEAVAKRNGVGTESVRRWYLQAQIDGGQRRGASSEELAEIKDLKAKVRRLEEDNDILRRASIFFAGELDPRTR